MGKPKIDKVKLSQMLRTGKLVKDCAKYFSVTPGAISQAKKELNVNVIKNIALENAGRVVDKNLDAVEQLQKINQDANEMLDLLMRWQRGDDEALQILESQVRQVNVGTKKAPEWVTQYKMKDPRELALRAMAEIRQQLGLQLEIFQTLYDMKAVQEFQEEVLTAIGEVDNDTRQRIIDKLNQKRAIRAAIRID